MAKKVNCKLLKDENGEYVLHYETNGFEGNSCMSIADAMASTGDMSEIEETDEMYTHRRPQPLPNELNG